MEQFHWTEKQMYDENTMARMFMISEYNEIRAAQQKEEERRAESEARSKRYR
jgi:hypothetical protein